MNKVKDTFFLLFIFLCCSTLSYAQVTANFSGSPLRGCAPLVVQFNNQSTGNPTSWSWSFGNGATSSLQNPATIYSIPGVYSVTLTVTNGGTTNTIVKPNYIVVYTKPAANFTVSSHTACVGQNLTFSDSSVISSGAPPISSWGWDFGDGIAQTVTTNTINHTYTAPGNYPVSLIITDTNGCTNTVTKNVQIIAPPHASFTASPVFACAAPLTVTFTNTSTFSGPVTYSWNLGNGAISASQNPSTTYTAAGSYPVTLVVNQGGCKDSVTIPNQVQIQNMNASFAATPSVICTGQAVTFTNTSTPSATNASWNFGDGSISTSINPVHTYTATGTYTVTLAASDANNCSGNTSGVITVNQTPSASFSADTLVACSYPLQVNFTNNSTGATSYNWNFGDGNTSSSANPSHVYTASGSYTVSLVATNGACKDSAVKPAYINISPPVAGFVSSPDSGCVPLNVTFISNSTSSLDPITSYTWNFGDGNSATGTSSNANNSYTVAGVFSPSLIVQTASGCRDTIVCSNCIRTGNVPTAAFSIANDTVCYGIPVTFTDQSTNATGWMWIFGDGVTSTLPNPTHVYGDTGTFQVKLVVYNNGCSDTSTIQKVTVFPPKAVITYTLSCINYYTVQFASASEGADSLFWDFGDGVLDSSNNINPTHTYPSRGPFTVTLVAYNYATGCNNSTTVTFTIAEPIASYTLPAVSGCYPFAPVFTSTSQDANTYYWNFGDLSTTADTSVLNNPTYTYNTPGAYTVSLIITDVNGCKDTAASVIKSLGPIPSFYADTLTGCRPLPVTFHDSSISDSTLVLWNWNFGDGTTASTTKDSIIHIYTVPGQYNVTMTVKDTNGCAKSITINNLIQPTFPYPAFTLDTFACAGDLLTFDASATSAVGPDYSWDFGDGTIINTTSPVVTHAYVNDSYYTVKLTVTDTNGCDSTIIYKTRILKPTANFNWSVLNAGCGTLQVAFQDSSQGFVSGWDWNFGNGANSNLQNPIYTYTQPGMYNVSLTVTNLGGCKDTVYKDSIIVVAGPVGTYSFSPTTGCNPLTVVFIANSANAQGYIWDFGDGIVVNSGDSISHTYTQQGSFNPVLVLEDTLSNGTPCLLPATNLTGTVSVTNVMNVSLSPMILYLPQDSFGIVTPAVSGGVSPYIITWSPSTNITCGSCAQVQVMGTGDTVRYVFMVKDNSGCIGYDSLLVYSNPCVEKSVIPNVFSPNGDGRNDFFFLPGICAGEDYSLEIYDRWGNLLFSSTSRNDVWDGKTTRGEPASEGTYYFVAKVKDASYKGFLQLTR